MSNLLQTKFSEREFATYASEHLPDFDPTDSRTEARRGFVGVKQIGESSKLDLVVFAATPEASIHARMEISKLSYALLKTHPKAHALIAYHSPDTDEWRLSLITTQVTRDKKGVKEAVSNPRRYSYVLGPKAKVNTPTKYLISKGKIVDLNDLKERFSLEVVNKDFYREISHLFIKLVGGFYGNGTKQKEYQPLLQLPSAPSKDQRNSEFAVRLIGRVIFSWFLREKKGPTNKPLMPRELLSLAAVESNPDYYHSILEPIFFEILNKHAKSRKEKYLEERFSSIPYLNGGLFSPEYDDYFSYNEGKQAIYHNTVTVPDEWVKEFFTFLETYNFTIDENVSFDEELSIDPEMLGRIFENLLAEINPETGQSARKSTGSYYTPRMIVDYMVDESLFAFLEHRTSISEDKLRAVISYDLEDNTSHPPTRDESTEIINALSSIKILDPACGSGAFPIGILQKIVFILQQVDPEGRHWFEKQVSRTSPEIRRVIEREFANKNFNYIRKLGVIRENIFGVDIQPIATEISRLRCFLTLIVDQSIHENLENRGIEPLPNLDFKFVTANTLIELPTTSTQTLFKDTERIEHLRDLRNQFFSSTNSERQRLQLEFQQLQNQMLDRMIEMSASDELTRALSTWKPFSHNVTQWFDPEWMFGIDAFDVIIGNPPYLKERGNKEKFLAAHKSALGRKYKKGKMDFWYYFLHRGIHMLANRGAIAFITPSYWTQGEGSARLVEHIRAELTFQAVINIGDLKVFEAVAGHHMVAVYNKETGDEKTFTYKQLVDSLDDLNSSVDTQHVTVKKLTNGAVFKAGKIDFDGGNPSLQTGHKLEDYFEVSQGVVEGTDRVARKHVSLTKEPVGSGIFVLKEQELNALSLNPDEQQFVKRYLDSSDLQKYGMKFSNKYLLYVNKENCPNIDIYPNLEKHLAKFRAITERRRETKNGSNQWFHLHWPRSKSYFDDNKIIFKGMFKQPEFSVDDSGYYFGMSMLSVIPTSQEFSLQALLGILNSQFAEKWFNKNGKKRGVGVDIGVAKLRDFPLPELTDAHRKLLAEIEERVSRVMASKKSGRNTESLESEIDTLVEKLYS